MQRLFLFDLDGTIMLSGGAGMRGMERVFLEFFGVPNAFEGILPDGKTDPMIFREMFANHNVDPGDEQQTLIRLEEGYIKYLTEEMPRSENARLMPGFPRILELLDADPEVHLGLLTGNYERGARIKLDRFGLNRFFPFGAFGSDSDLRRDLVEVALRRAGRVLGKSIEPGRHAVIIGDTPRDVDCGKQFGLTTVAVATGSFDARSLEESGADLVFENFSDVEAVISAIKNATLE